MIVRAVHLAFDVPDASGANATAYYPADERRLDEARLTGAVPAVDDPASWPVVVVLPGINVAPDSYRGLAGRLVAAGYVAVTYSAIGHLGPAGVGITPGIDMAALAAGVAGTRSSATAVPPLLAALAALGDTPISGRLDLGRTAMVGHSAGGTIALHNTDPEWVPGLRAVATYGAHTMTSTSLGHDEASVVPIPGRVPVLLSGGAADAVIDASRDRYRTDGGVHDPIGRTFAEALAREAGDSWLIELDLANHFTICDPVDETSGRSFLEPDLRADDSDARDLLARLVIAFLDLHVPAEARGDGPEGLVDRPGIHRWARR